MSLSYVSTLSVICLFLLGSALADCPTWFYHDNTTQQSHCGYEFLCSSNNKVRLKMDCVPHLLEKETVPSVTVVAGPPVEI